jgi:hypothetical protein
MPYLENEDKSANLAGSRCITELFKRGVISYVTRCSECNRKNSREST